MERGQLQGRGFSGGLLPNDVRSCLDKVGEGFADRVPIRLAFAPALYSPVMRLLVVLLRAEWQGGLR